MKITIETEKVLINGLSFRCDQSDPVVPLRIYCNRKHIATVPTAKQPNGKNVYGIGLLNWAIHHYVLGSLVSYIDHKELGEKLMKAALAIGLPVVGLELGKYYQVPFVDGTWVANTQTRAITLAVTRTAKDDTHRRCRVYSTPHDESDQAGKKEVLTYIPISHDGYTYAGED